MRPNDLVRYHPKFQYKCDDVLIVLKTELKCNYKIKNDHVVFGDSGEILHCFVYNSSTNKKFWIPAERLAYL